MDENLLGRAVEYHGPDFLRQMQLEQEHIPPNIFLHLQKHRPQAPEISDPQFILNMRRFISKKADMLFRPIEKIDRRKPDQTVDEDSYAKMPPLETFMGIDPHTARKHLYHSLQTKDIAIGVVTSIIDTGLILQLLCLNEDKNRDIDDLRINAFVHSAEIPKMFPTQNPVEGYQVKDLIRGVIVNVNPETETILVSLMDTALGDIEGHRQSLGLIHEEDFPVQYRRKLHIRGLTFDELVNSIIGFTNPGNVQFLMNTLKQKEDVSMMRGLYRLKISEKDYADSLRKSQSQKWAYNCVAQGIHDFKAGRQTEAMQSFNKALQIDKSNVEALVARGALYANNESYTRALTDFEEAISINPKHPNAIKYMHETLLAKGKCHEDDKQLDDAKRCYQRAVEIMPDSSEAKEYLRYLEYLEERDIGRSNKVKKERTPSPVPYKETTDTLKMLIKEDKKVSRTKRRDSSDEKPRKGRSPVRRQRKSSSSSSGSSSSSSSSSRSSSSRKYNKSRSKRSPSLEYTEKKRKSKSKESVKGEPEKKLRGFDQRSKSRDKFDGRKSESKVTDIQVKEENFLYGKSQSKEVKKETESVFYSFSRNNEKIPGLGESPPPEDMSSEKQYSDEKLRSRSPFADKKSSQMESKDASEYPNHGRHSPRKSFGEPPPSRPRPVERSPSLGREGNYDYRRAESGKGDYRSLDKDFKENDDINRDDDEFLYGRSLSYEQGETVKESYHHKYESSRNRSRSRDRQISIGNKPHQKIPDRRDSVTPTKDEVSDRLGLEDISSPEEHDHHGDLYRYRGYRRTNDNTHYRKYEKQEDYRYRESGREGHLDDRLFRDQRRYSPDRRGSPRRRGSPWRMSPDSSRYRSPRHGSPRFESPPGYRSPRQESQMYETPSRRRSPRQASQVYETPTRHRSPRHESPYRHGSAPKQQDEYTRSSATRGRKDYQSPEEVQERRIISVSKKERKQVSNSYESDRQSFSKGSPMREDDRRRSGDSYQLGESQERRSVMIGKVGKEVTRRSPSPRESRRRESADKKEGKWKETFKTVRSRSKSPEYRQSNDQYSHKPDDDYYEKKQKEEYIERRRASVGKRRDSSRSRSKSPGRKRDRSISKDREDETYKRVIAVKPRKTESKDNLSVDRGLSRGIEVDFKSNNEASYQDYTESTSDIFADLPPPRANKEKQMFSTYVPRSVKLKQQQPAGINPESRPLPSEQKVEFINQESRIVNIRSVEDMKSSRTDDSSGGKHDPRSKYKPKSPARKSRSPARKSRSSKYRSRSRSRSRSYDKYKKNKRSRSRSHSRRSRSRSRSHDRFRSKKDDYRGHKRSYSSSSSRSRSRSVEKSSSAKKSKTYKSSEKKTAPVKVEVELPMITSRWDSPEEKISRWGNLDAGPKLMPEASVSQAQEKIASMLAAHLISKSPPPHRRMKPEEKVALKKKWKELSVSPLQGASDEDDLPNIVKARAADVQQKLLSIQTDKSDISEKDNNTKKPLKNIDKKGARNIKKLMKLKGLRSKWDSDSDSVERSKSRSSSRSPSRSSKTKNKKELEEKRNKSDSRERSRDRNSVKKNERPRSSERKQISSSRIDDQKTRKSRSKERKLKKSRSRSRDRKSRKSRSRSKERKSRKSRSRSRERKSRKSRSRSKDRKSRRSRSRSRVRKSSRDQKERSRSKERERGKKRDSGKKLPDVVESVKKMTEKSPKSRKSQSSSKKPTLKPTFKSRWSSDSDSSDNDMSKKTQKETKGGAILPKDSLTELEEFYKNLKKEKMRQLSSDKK